MRPVRVERPQESWGMLTSARDQQLFPNAAEAIAHSKDYFFFLAYAMWLSAAVLSASFYEPHIVEYRRVFTYGAMLLLILHEMNYGKWSRTDCLAVPILVVFLLSAIATDQMALMQTALLIVCARRVNFVTIARFGLVITAVLLAFVILSSFIGAIENYSVDSAGRNRFFLGFRYALYPAEFLFAITCLYVVLRRGKPKLFDIVILTCVNAAVFFMTGSRLAFFSSMLVIAASPLLSSFKHFCDGKSATWKYICYAAFPAAGIISIIVTASFSADIPWMAMLDRTSVLTGRLSMGQDALSSYGISLFGQDVYTHGASVDGYGQWDNTQPYFYIDNLYIQLLVKYGLITAVVFVALMTCVTAKAWNTRRPYLAFILVVIAAHAIIQDYVFSLAYNPFLFLISGLLLPSAAEQGAREVRRRP